LINKKYGIARMNFALASVAHDLSV